METKQYVSELSEKSANALSVLNAYKSALIKESKDSKLLEAAKALESAKVAYQKAVNTVVLGDSGYKNLQTECVRGAVSEFAHAHNAPAFLQWFNDNGKDEQTGVIDTLQRLGSHIKGLHDSFAKGAKVARKKAKTLEELKAEAAEMLAKIAAIENGGK